MGGSIGKYRRERQKGFRAIVAEVYSPPRVTAAAKLLPELKLIPGFGLDLTTNDADGRAWNFDEKEMRERAMAKLKAEEPQLLVGSPMCTALSTWLLYVAAHQQQDQGPDGRCQRAQEGERPPEVCRRAVPRASRSEEAGTFYTNIQRMRRHGRLRRSRSFWTRRALPESRVTSACMGARPRTGPP